MHEVQSMKRTLYILAAVLLASALFLPARALAEEDSVLLSVASVRGEIGETVDVIVSMRNCKSVVSAEFDINYDAIALSVVSITPGDIFPAQYCVTYTGNPGTIGIACAQALGFTGDGVLLTIRFKITGESGSPLTITSHLPTSGDLIGEEVTWLDENYDQHAAFVAIEHGGVSVGEAPLPNPAVTPWVPATPLPTPSPTPEITETPEAEASVLQTIDQQQTATPEIAAPALLRLNPTVYYVGGGLLLAAAALVIILFSRKRKQG
jgi:hypothetical protein